MRLTEQEFRDLIAKKKATRIILPFRLPTWNQILKMDWRQQKAVRTWIKNAVFMCITGPNVWQTPTGVVAKLSLTDLSLQEYLKMIVPKSSQKYLSRKKSLKWKKL